MTSLIILVTPVHGKSLRWCKCHKSFITTGIFKKKNLRWMDIDAKRLYFGPKICVFNLPKGAEFLTPPEAFNLAEKLRSYILVKEIMAPTSEKAV